MYSTNLLLTRTLWLDYGKCVCCQSEGTSMKDTILQRGQGLAEYAIIIMLIAIVVIAIVAIFGDDVAGLYSEVVAQWPGS